MNQKQLYFKTNKHTREEQKFLASQNHGKLFGSVILRRGLEHPFIEKDHVQGCRILSLWEVGPWSWDLFPRERAALRRVQLFGFTTLGGGH